MPKVSSLNRDFSDQRPVTSVNVIAKVYEYCFYAKLNKFIITGSLQMEFTSGVWCEKAVLIVRSVVDYFTKYRSNEYISALDLSKAFDRINQC